MCIRDRTTYGAVVALIIGALWLASVWSTREQKVWLGTAPMMGILFASIMITPLIEDIVTKSMNDDRIPAYILGSYFIVGAAIYVFYGYRNSRLAQGLDCVDDSPLPGPNEALAHGLDERR